jgi:hypothetical protein
MELGEDGGGITVVGSVMGVGNQQNLNSRLLNGFRNRKHFRAAILFPSWCIKPIPRTRLAEKIPTRFPEAPSLHAFS